MKRTQWSSITGTKKNKRGYGGYLLLVGNHQPLDLLYNYEITQPNLLPSWAYSPISTYYIFFLISYFLFLFFFLVSIFLI